MKDPRDERRRAKRLRKPFALVMRKVPHAPEQKWVAVLVKDISASGVSFHTTEDFHREDVLDLRLTIEEGVAPLECTGRVARVADCPEEKLLIEIGLTFTGIAEMDVDWLKRIVKQNDPDRYK